MNNIKYQTHLIRLLVLSILLLPKAHGSQTSTDLTATFGNLCEYVGQIQTDESGDKNVCSFMPYIATSFDISIDNNFHLSPQIGTSFPQSGRDQNVKRMAIFGLANLKYKFEHVTLVSGLGLFLTRIWGPGGAQLLNNGGNNNMDSFPLPSEAVYSRNTIVNFGAGLNLNEEVSAEIYTYVFNALTSEDRSYSIGLSATYHFGDLL